MENTKKEIKKELHAKAKLEKLRDLLSEASFLANDLRENDISDCDIEEVLEKVFEDSYGNMSTLDDIITEF